MIKFLLQVLGNEESDKVQALICTGFAKLMVSGMISEERVCALSMIFLSAQPSDGPTGVGQLGIDPSLT